jgi:hypothetical protein
MPSCLADRRRIFGQCRRIRMHCGGRCGHSRSACAICIQHSRGNPNWAMAPRWPSPRSRVLRAWQSAWRRRPCGRRTWLLRYCTLTACRILQVAKCCTSCWIRGSLTSRRIWIGSPCNHNDLQARGSLAGAIAQARNAYLPRAGARTFAIIWTSGGGGLRPPARQDCARDALQPMNLLSSTMLGLTNSRRSTMMGDPGPPKVLIADRWGGHGPERHASMCNDAIRTNLGNCRNRSSISGSMCASSSCY